MFRWTIRTFQAAVNPFAAYREIGNASRGKVEMMRKAPKDDWIACEKVHGSNFGIYMLLDTSGKPRFSYSKRSGMLRPDEDFFGYQCLAPELEKHIAHARERLSEILGMGVSGVLLNGELFGGKYTHPQVPPSKQIARVGNRDTPIQAPQKDDFPQYTPNLSFYAFDLKYKVKRDDSWVLCTFDTMTSVCEKIPNLLYSKPVVRGKLDSILAFDVENFQTTIPAQLGLGDYPLVNNWAEGLVVRNVGFGSPGMDDLMFKWKASKFQEIRHKDQIFEDPLAAARAIALKKVGAQLPRAETVFPKKEQCDALQLLLDHIVKTRLDNLISKIGPEPLLKGEETPVSLAKLLAKDALKDFLKEKADYSIVNMPLVYRREMSLRCLFEARLLVNKEWDGILKGFAPANAKTAPSPSK
jgi:RNA-editing ligase